MTKFTYDGADVLLDQNADGTTVKYLNGAGIDTKLRQTTSSGQTNYFLSDHLGSTNALVSSAGAITSQASYDGFGNQSGNLATRYGYTGRERDSSTGLMHYRARQYSPELGRFISEDPIGFAGGDVNLFAYVNNNPVNFVDPTGNIPLPLITAGIGAAAGGLGTIVGKGLANWNCGRSFFYGADKWNGYWDDVAIGIGGGAATGALMGTPLGASMAGAAIVGGGGNLIQYAYSSAYHNTETTIGGAIFAGTTGALGGLVGGATAMPRASTPLANIRDPLDRIILQKGFNKAASDEAVREATRISSYGKAAGGGLAGNGIPGGSCDCS